MQAYAFNPSHWEKLNVWQWATTLPWAMLPIMNVIEPTNSYSRICTAEIYYQIEEVYRDKAQTGPEGTS